MHKIISILAIISALFISGKAYAASPLSIRLEQPKTPTNQNTFNIVFATLDIGGRTVTVKCYKKGPSDSSPVQFGSDIVLTNGGNSGNCQVTSGQINGNGTYTFSVTASADGDTASDTTTVVYNTDGPGDPKDYNKTKIANCTYSIHFKTANDGGKTVKTEVYRSENMSFNTDSGTQVGTVNAGSDEPHDFTNDVPNCDKTYYYAIRSFDSAGNGSGVVGDSVTTTHLTTISPTLGAGQGAIPGGAGGNVLGTQTNGTDGSTEPQTASGDALGGATPSAETVTLPGETGGLFGLLSNKKAIGLAVALIVGGMLLYAKTHKQD